MEFGEYLRKIRKEKGLSLREAAKRSGISHPYLSQLETGKNTQPTKEIINKIAKGLGTPNGNLLMLAGYIDDPFDHIDNNKAKISFYVDKYEKVIDENGGETTYAIPPGEAIRRLNDVFHVLKKEEPVYYNGNQLTKEQKSQAIKVLNALFNE